VNVVPGSFAKCVGIKLGWEPGYRLIEMPPRRLKTASRSPTAKHESQGGKLYPVMREINRIIIHCSATREGQDIDAATIKKWHTEDRGWSDIGYHYCIKLDGTLETGRPLDRAGAHVKGHNSDSIGICYIGGLEEDGKTPKDTMTPAQEHALRELIFSLRMVWDKELTLHGHNEYSNKACPSFKVSEKFADIL